MKNWEQERDGAICDAFGTAIMGNDVLLSCARSLANWSREWEKTNESAPWTDIASQYHKQLKEERAKSKKLLEALEIYANKDNYEYDKVKGRNYMWNDHGETASAAIAAYKGEE